MKKVMKIALGAVMLAGAAIAVVTPANARVSVGIGLGGPAYAGYYDPGYAGYSCDPYSRWYAPAYCGPAYYGYGPDIVIGGHFGGGFHGGGFHGGGHGHR
jgi:hypothetical protein